MQAQSGYKFLAVKSFPTSTYFRSYCRSILPNGDRRERVLLLCNHNLQRSATTDFHSLAYPHAEALFRCGCQRQQTSLGHWWPTSRTATHSNPSPESALSVGRLERECISVPRLYGSQRYGSRQERALYTNTHPDQDLTE